MSTEPRRWEGLKRFLIGRSFCRTLLRIAVLIAIVAVSYRWIFLPFLVDGDSMLPALRDGNVHIAYRLAYRSQEPQRGDMVVLNIAGGRDLLVKRIIGLPGERFAIKEGVVLINGEPLDEPYLKLRSRDWELAEVVLRPEEFYFIGDNRSMNMANHTAGTIRVERILGRVIY